MIVRPDGIGPAKAGMSLSELRRVMGEKLAGPSSLDEPRCYFTDSRKHPGVSFMIEEGRLARIDITNHAISTEKGIQVGDSEAHAQAVYAGRLKSEPNAYEPDEHVLTYLSKNGKQGIKFIMEQKKIRVIYAGFSGPISYIEGCE